MPEGAVVAAAGGQVAGAIIQSRAASEATSAQRQSDRQWRHQQADQYADSMRYARGRDRVSDARYEDAWNANATYRNAGKGAMRDYRRLADVYAGDTFEMGDFKTDPGYKFRLGEGSKAVERMGGVNGSPFSGATLKALTQYNQDFASNEYGNVYARRFGEFQANENQQMQHLMSLSDMARMGMAPMPGPASNNFPGMPSTTPAYSGADGTMAQGNIWGNAANNAGNLAAMYYMYNQ